MPKLTMLTFLHISVGLLLLECWPRAVSANMLCYSCKSMQNLPHSMNCIETSDLTHIEECPPTAKYCKKRVAAQENNTVIERTCEEKCYEQINIKMMSGVVIDTYCCETDLCNSATTCDNLKSVILIAFVVKFLWL